VSLDTYTDAGSLYTARTGEVNANRPTFTGDVFRNMAIPGVQQEGLAMIVAHPCSFRKGAGQLNQRVLVTTVEPVQKVGRNAWTKGLFDRMPLPDLDGDGMWAAHFGGIGHASTSDFRTPNRFACLSEIGINILQQRLTFHLTRVEIPTRTFNEAFAHTLVEADLLEDWTDTLFRVGWPQTAAAAAFEDFIRSGEHRLQDELLDPQRRSHVRTACTREAKRLAADEISARRIAQTGTTAPG